MAEQIVVEEQIVEVEPIMVEVEQRMVEVEQITEEVEQIMVEEQIKGTDLAKAKDLIKVQDSTNDVLNTIPI